MFVRITGCVVCPPAVPVLVPRVTCSMLTVQVAVAPAACAVPVAGLPADVVADGGGVTTCEVGAELELAAVVAGLLVELLEALEEHPAASRPAPARQADTVKGLRNCMKCLLEGRR